MHVSSFYGAASESDGSGSCVTLASHSLSEPASPGLENGGDNPHFTLRPAEPMCVERLADSWSTVSGRVRPLSQGRDPAGAYDRTAPKWTRGGAHPPQVQPGPRL